MVENEERKKAEGLVEDVKRSVDAVLRTEEGRKLFAHLHLICGYSTTSIVIDRQTGGALAEATVYNEARRGVYIYLRRLASYDLLKVAEELAERPAQSEIKKSNEEKK